MASVVISPPKGYFNGVFQSLGGGNITVQLKDTVTGDTGDGTYEVNFADNLLSVLGTGPSSPGVFVVRFSPGSTDSRRAPVFPYSTHVLKGWTFTVVNGQVVGATDQRVLGGVGTANLKDGAVTITKIANGVVAIANCADVLEGTLANGDVLTYNAGIAKWVNAPAAADTDSLATLTDVNLSTLTDRQALQYDAASGKWIDTNLTATDVNTLPTADSAHVGQIVRLVGTSGTTPDMFYICRMRKDGTYKWCRFQGRAFQIKLCSADFTPTSMGTDLGGLWPVPYDIEEDSDVSVTWTVVKLFFRVETQGSTDTSVKIQRSTGTGNFVNAGYLNTTALTVSASTNEASTRTFAQATVNSGDKLLPEYTALGTGAAGFTLVLSLRES